MLSIYHYHNYRVQLHQHHNHYNSTHIIIFYKRKTKTKEKNEHTINFVILISPSCQYSNNTNNHQRRKQHSKYAPPTVCLTTTTFAIKQTQLQHKHTHTLTLVCTHDTQQRATKALPTNKQQQHAAQSVLNPTPTHIFPLFVCLHFTLKSNQLNCVHIRCPVFWIYEEEQTSYGCAPDPQLFVCFQFVYFAFVLLQFEWIFVSSFYFPYNFPVLLLLLLYDFVSALATICHCSQLAGEHLSQPCQLHQPHINMLLLLLQQLLLLLFVGWQCYLAEIISSH